MKRATGEDGLAVSYGGMFRPLSTRRAFEELLDQFVDAITSGRLQEGDPLPPERQLAELFEVSRPTVRQAVGVLVRAGVLDVRRGAAGGISVRSTRIPADVTATATAVVATEIAYILEARRMIEPGVAILAGRRADDQDHARMQAAIDRDRVPGYDPARWPLAGLEFHRALWRSARNPVLERMLKTYVRAVVVPADLYPYSPEALEADCGWDQRTLDAVRSRDEARIAEVMDGHLAVLEQALR